MNDTKLETALAPYITKRDEAAEEAAVACARHHEQAAAVADARRTMQEAARELKRLAKQADAALHRSWLANQELDTMRAELSRNAPSTKPTRAERRLANR